jgi:hypothetical protein
MLTIECQTYQYSERHSLISLDLDEARGWAGRRLRS